MRDRKYFIVCSRAAVTGVLHVCEDPPRVTSTSLPPTLCVTTLN